MVLSYAMPALQDLHWREIILSDILIQSAYIADMAEKKNRQNEQRSHSQTSNIRALESLASDHLVFSRKSEIIRRWVESQHYSILMNL